MRLLALTPRAELFQHSGFLHAGVVGAFIDTACGFAAASVSGNIVVSQYQVRCYRPAFGSRFIARAHAGRSGKRQIFASSELFAINGEDETLVTRGDAILIPVT
jgi:acyl-coenzyme A thioesterase PaaI-like protein